MRLCGKTPSVLVLRSTVMTPYLAGEEDFGAYFERLRAILGRILSRIEAQGAGDGPISGGRGMPIWPANS